jgi:uncharacterized protein YodC (DUF2158 family)
MEFQPGDLVQLKSGGPLMTVEQVGELTIGGQGVWCVWFEKVGNRQVAQREMFPPVTLQKATRPGVGVVSVGRA